jgi:tight adherence protein B
MQNLNYGKIKQKQKKSMRTDYQKPFYTFWSSVLYFLTGFTAIFIIFYIFYKIIFLAIAGGILGGFINIKLGSRNSMEKRLMNLRLQFFELLQSLAASMRAGNNIFNALESAEKDLKLLYSEESDIINELKRIINGFKGSIPLSKLFNDFADRSGLEDIKSFASIFNVIESKSSNSDQIIKQTQQIISEKMETELEIETLLTSAKSEVNIMLCMPLVILLIIGYMGEGFMDAIYTTDTGRIVATIGLIIYIISYILSKKIININI